MTIALPSCQRNPEQKVPVKAEGQQDVLYWTCGMHPSVRVSPNEYSRGRTKCPICNMDLVPVRKGKEREAEGVVSLTLSERAKRLASVRTFQVTYLPLEKVIRAVGKIDYDERRLAYVASWIPGRIDKLFVNFTGVKVKKGDPLLWIYSPNLVTAQQEYLLALETFEKVKTSHIQEVVDNARSLIESAKKRLILWGVTEEQIKELKQRGSVETHLTIYSPISGTVIRKTALEGKYVKEGEEIFCIADLSIVWMLADIYEEDLSLIRLGQKVKITSTAFPGEVFEGRISFINPYLNEKTRTVKIRVDVPNPEEKLKPGMYVNALIKVPLGLVLAVPKSAVLDVGMRKLVYLDKGEGRYEARQVKVGLEAEARVGDKRLSFFPVIEGLAEGERVVTRANFLIDSQTQLTGEAAGAYGGALEVEER